MATEVVHTIKVDGTGDYTSLSAWETAQQRNLVSADEIAVAECYTGQSTTVVIVSGWTTDETRYVHIRNAAGHHHLGDPTAGFRQAVSNTTAALQIQNSVRVTGIVVVQTSGTTGNGIRANGGAHSWVNECIIGNGGAGTSGITIEVGNSTGRYYNNILFDWGTAGIRSNAVTNCTVHAYNNTVYNCATGILRTAGTMRPKNNVVQGGTTCFSGTMTNSATNIASDATAEIQATLTFVDSANDDYHLSASDTAAIDAGTDLSADANIAFSTDIDGDSRPQGSAWDIGADERVATAVVLTAGGGTYTLSGTAATLRWDRDLAGGADAGTYTITGQAATLRREVHLTADSGSYTLTGTDATLVHGYYLLAEEATFILSGTTAVTRWDHDLAGGVGSFLLTGTAATLTRGVPLSAEGGEFVLSGTDATLTWAKGIIAESGFYTLTGTAATLTGPDGTGGGDTSLITSGTIRRRRRLAA